MKLKVVKDFNDRITGKLHKIGDILNDVEKARGEELLDSPHKVVTLIREDKVVDEKKSSKKSSKK